MGLEVYLLVILTSLEVVNAHNNFGEGTSGPERGIICLGFLTK